MADPWVPPMNPGRPWHEHLREDRIGIGLHYDGSVRDAGALAWLLDPRCRVSYHALVWDNGNIHQVAPWSARAWHMGPCRTSDPVRLPYRDANSAFYGIAIAAQPPDVATGAQRANVVALCQSLFRREGWLMTETWRIVGHHTEAWPRGRKTDPPPCMQVEEIRAMMTKGVGP